MTNPRNMSQICTKIHVCLHYLHIFSNNLYSYNYGSAVSSWIKDWGYMAFPQPHFPSGKPTPLSEASKIMPLEFPISKCLHFGLEILVLIVLHISTHGDLKTWCCPNSVRHFVENITFDSHLWPGWHEIWLVRSTWLSANFLFPFSYCKFYNLVFNSISSLEIRHLSLLNFHLLLDNLLGIYICSVYSTLHSSCFVLLVTCYSFQSMPCLASKQWHKAINYFENS